MIKETINIRNILSSLLLLAIVGVVVFYSLYQSRALRAGPEIAFAYPLDGATLETSPIVVRGNALRISFLELNGREIYTNEAGDFEEKLPLLPGHNIMELQAQDRFGRITTKRLYLQYDGD